MRYELKDIKEVRKKFNLTQTDLARKSGVSQSLIAKIEAGRVDPTYTNAKKIFEALEVLTKKDEAKAEEIMNKKIISVNPDSVVQEAVNKMKGYDISQLPVIDKESLVGYLSETDVIDALMGEKKDAKIKDIMKDAPPTIDRNASMTVVSELLKSYPMVIVVEKGKLLGLITKSDILGRFVHRKRLGLF